MKNTLNIGSIKLPKESATKGFGFIGKRGSGKSYGAAVFAEELYKASIPFVVFDPIDVWWGLKVAADGKGKGLPIVVFGKEHADIQLDRTMGKRIAQAFVKENISCVISTFGMNKTEMREIIGDFSEELLRINNTPRQVIIEEAHEFVPQRVQGGATKCFAAVEALLVMGRNRGIGVTLLNQRMATLNKDLLTQIDVLVAFRSVGPQDRRAFKDWVEVHNDENDENFDAFMKSVPSLPTGTAWVWSPEFLEVFEKVKFRARNTFHPDREKLGMTFKMPEIKQGDVQAFIDSFSKKPETKPVLVNAKPKGEVATAMGVSQWMNYGAKYGYDKFFEEKITQKINKQWEDAYSKLWMVCYNSLTSGLDAVKRWQKPEIKQTKVLTNKELAIGQRLAKQLDDAFWPTPDTKSVELARHGLVLENKEISDQAHVKFDGVSKPEQRVLDAIAWLNSTGQKHSKKEAVAPLAGYRLSGSYQNILGSLRTKGMISYPVPGALSLTEAGKDIASFPLQPAETNEEFHSHILKVLSNPEQRVLGILLGAQGKEVPKDELAALSGYQVSGSFQNILGGLRTLEFVYYPRPGYVEATAIMFPFQ